MFCWYCYWGWSKQVVEIYNKYGPIAGYEAMHYGAAHIIWDDENFERENIQWCLDNFEKYKREESTENQNKAVKNSLIELLKLDDNIRCPEPEDYDGENPHNFPPKIKLARPMSLDIE
jgi:hypothetical protein